MKRSLLSFFRSYAHKPYTLYIIPLIAFVLLLAVIFLNTNSVLVIVIAVAIVWIIILSKRLTKESAMTVTSNTVSFRLKNIGEMATQEGYFRNVQVISEFANFFGVNIQFMQSKYIFSYDGVIKAGVNFRDIEASVDQKLKKIVVKMPEAKVFSTDVDFESLKVFHEANNIFVPLKVEKMNKALVELKNEALNVAIEQGLLVRALSNAETLINGFLANFFSLEEYSIDFVRKDAHIE